MKKEKGGKWLLFRDGLVFQVKLTLDALRDFLLSPAAIVCLILDLIKNNSRENSYFHRLMVLGGKSDKWLNLFNNHNENEKNINEINSNVVKRSGENEHTDSFSENFKDFETHQANNNLTKDELLKVSNNSEVRNDGVDKVFDKIEDVIKEQLAKGELTRTTKDKLEKYLSQFQLTQFSSKDMLSQAHETKTNSNKKEEQ